MAVFQRWEGPGGARGDPASSESSSRLGWERDDGESSHLPRQTRGPAGEEQGVSATPTAFQKEDGGGSSLVAQWQRIHLPTQETRVRSLVHEDPTGCGATKPALQLLSCALDPESHDYQPTRCNDRGRVP